MVVHGSFPGSALISQLFRQLTKPMSQRIVRYAARHPIFRRYFLLGPGRIYYKLENGVQMLKAPARLVDPTQKVTVPPIKDEEAIQLGSQLMIEIVIFAFLVALMAIESLRSQLKSAEEENRRQQEFEDLERRRTEARERLEALVCETEIVRAQRDELLRILEGLHQQQPD